MAAFTYHFQTNYVLIKYLYLVILFHYVISTSSASSHSYTTDKILKCCTNDNVLAFSDSKNKNNSEIDGGGNKTNTNNYLRCHKNNNITKLIGINLKEINKDDIDDYDKAENKIPQCIDKDIINLDDSDGSVISYNGCIDYIDDTIYGISCKHADKIIVHRVNKCCPINFSYDKDERQCVANNNDLQLLTPVFKASICVLKTMIPNCTNNEVFVEYHTTSDRLQIIANSELEILLTKGGYENLPSRSYCIEGIDNDDGVGSDNEIIVRGCRPKSICEQIPCVRRCCKNEQIFRRIDNVATCMDYDKNLKPTFHDIEWPMHENSVINEIELNGKVAFFFFFNYS